MTLPADALAQLRTGLAPLATTGTTVSWALKTAGVFGTDTPLSVVISDDVTTQERDETSNEAISVRRLTVLPLAAAAARLGDRVTYAGVNFVITAISSLDVPTWVAEYRSSIGGQRKQGFRAVGGGA